MALNQLNETSLSITGRQRSSSAPAPGEEDARPLPVPAQTPLALRRRAASRPEIPPQAIEKARFGLGLWPAEAPSVGRPFGRPSHDGLSTAPGNAHAVRRRRRTALPGRTRDRAPPAFGAGRRPEIGRKRLKRLDSGSGFGKPRRRPWGVVRRPSHDGLSTAPGNAHAVRRRRRTALPGRTGIERRTPAGQRQKSKMAPQAIEKAQFGVGFGKPKSFSRP